MKTTISQQDYWDLFIEVEQNSPQIDSSDVTYAYPSQLGKGYSRLIELRSGLELSIERYQLHDRLIMQQSDRDRLYEARNILRDRKTNKLLII